METALSRLNGLSTRKITDTTDTYTTVASDPRTAAQRLVDTLIAAGHTIAFIPGGKFTITPTPDAETARAIRGMRDAVYSAALLAATCAQIAAKEDVCAECGAQGTDRLLDGTWRCSPHGEAYWAARYPVTPPGEAAAHLARVQQAHAATATTEGRLFG